MLFYNSKEDSMMNNKGFAISVILYSIVFLIVTILYMLLGIEKNRYNVNEELRRSIIEQLNENDEGVSTSVLPITDGEGGVVCHYVEEVVSDLEEGNCIATNAPENPSNGSSYVVCNESYKKWVSTGCIESICGSEYKTFYEKITYTYVCE